MNSARDVSQPPVEAQRPTLQLMIGGIIIPILVAGVIAIFVGRILLTASATVLLPRGTVAQVYAAPGEDSPLLARFGAGHALRITGRTADWRWLQIALWDGKQGWVRRPLDVLVWSILAEPTGAVSSDAPAPQPSQPDPEVMIDIPGGTFVMGSQAGMGEADERPARNVTLSPFRMNRTEVTQRHYWACVIAGACTPAHDPDATGGTRYLYETAYDNHPVINVNWDQASAYCAWQGKRLPTEAEWEMAAGWNPAAKSASIWPWGNAAPSLAVNININTSPLPVGTSPGDVGIYGLLDMGGNVREWVLDNYKVNYYTSDENTNPRGPTYRRGEGEGHAVRGASFADPIDRARVANRNSDDSAIGQRFLGFRCARGA